MLSLIVMFPHSIEGCYIYNKNITLNSFVPLIFCISLSGLIQIANTAIYIWGSGTRSHFHYFLYAIVRLRY